jgi:glucokinase
MERSSVSSRLSWGVDIGGTTTIVGSLDGEGCFRLAAEIPTRPSEGYERLFTGTAAAIAAVDPEPRAIGVGIAGLVDHRRGFLGFSPNLPGWDDLDVATILGHITGAAVTVDNDCNAFAFGAIRSGLVPGTGLNLFVTLGTGIGGTIIQDRSILYGTGYAGEFGHMAVEASGLACPCGSTGCWERYCGREAVIRYYLGHSGDGGQPDPRVIAARARGGEARALHAFEVFGTWLGTGLASLSNCFSPDGFYLAGGLTGASDLFLPAAEAGYRRRCRHPWVVFRVPGSSEAGALGAAHMARELAT